MTAVLSINGRFRGHTTHGVQRIAAAYIAQIKTPHVVLQPARTRKGVEGHAWEQFVLPRLTRDQLLWSSCNTGPLATSRQIVTMHDAAVFDHPEWFSKGFVALYNSLLPRLARRCLKITTVSAFSRSRLAYRLGIEPKKIEVIWNGVDKHFFPIDLNEIHAAKTLVGLGEARYFASLATLEPRKNLDLVFRAWTLARPHLPAGMKLLVIGKKGAASVFGNDGTSYARSEDILYTGYVEESVLPALLTGAEALLYPSRYEGFGLPIVEAMACGTPVMTTARTCLPEIAGDAAVYVDTDDPEDMAKQLIRMARSVEYRNEYSGRGLDRSRLFQWSDSVRRMDALFAALA